MGKITRVLVAGPNARKASDLARLLNGTGEFRCRATTADSGQSFEGVGSGFDMIFLFPSVEVDQTLSWIQVLRPRTRSLLLLDELTFSRLTLLSALVAGADGIVAWPASIREIRDAVDVVRRGGAPVPPELNSLLLERLRNGRHLNPAWHSLTHAEARVMEEVRLGLSNKLIADKLGIVVGTVQNHLNNVYRKLRVNSRTQALESLFGTTVSPVSPPAPQPSQGRN
jgi:DNA-binding NarL/FixJ family response regulator